MILSIAQDAKTIKGEQYGFLTGILYLAPSDVSGRNVCPLASEGCRKACLYTAGHGRYTNVQKARIERTRLWFDERDYFYTQLRADIHFLKRKAFKLGMVPAVRLNGTSDILSGDHIKLIRDFHDVQFYDYTKVPTRFRIKETNGLHNYHLTFSRSESNEAVALTLLEAGHNVAVVFDKLPETWHGYPVFDGDKSDLRFLDPKVVVVGLKAKGDARKDKSGFTVHTK